MDPKKKNQYSFGIDPSLEDLKHLPGGEGIYDYVRKKAEELAAAVDVATSDLIDRHELPLDPGEISELGYVIAIETHQSEDGVTRHRAAVLYKRIDEVEIKV